MILITGGSSGIGLELAKLFARDKKELLLVAKPLAELQSAQQLLQQQYPNVTIHIFQQDLTLPNATQQVYEFVQKEKWEIEVLVNSAGVGTYGFINDIDLERELQMIRLNVEAVYCLTRLFLTDMIDKDCGKILNIASVAGYQPNPLMATYGATKSFVLNFSRAIYYELKARGSHVQITTICPPPTRTPFKQKAGMIDTVTFNTWIALDAPTVAYDAYWALQKGKREYVPGFGSNYLHKIVKRLPTNWLAKIAKHQLRKK